MPPLPMLMSPLRYAVTRKSRAISALSLLLENPLCPPRRSHREPYCSISETFLARVEIVDRAVELIEERGNG